MKVSPVYLIELVCSDASRQWSNNNNNNNNNNMLYCIPVYNYKWKLLKMQGIP